MKPDPRARRIAIFGSLALAVLAIRWVDGEPQVQRANAAQRRESTAATGPSVRAAPPGIAGTALDLSRLKRGGTGPHSSQAFGARSWDPPPRKLGPREIEAQRAMAEPPPPPPQAPPLPFTYLGMLGDEDETTVFLGQQDTNYAVKKGDVINGTYRVEEVESGRVVLTYLPLDQRQTLTATTTE